jgi:hypothetical protein
MLFQCIRISEPNEDIEKNSLAKQMERKAGGITQVVEHLPSKCKALISNPSTNKETKKK